jgi:hypothetical protein
MLIEAKHVVQDSDEATRRWFYDKDFNLYTWHNAAGDIVRFELCYIPFSRFSDQVNPI